MKSPLCIFFILAIALPGIAQLNLQQINGLPTRELYDLHVDKKGYLWIAHDLGISRFDGLSFQHFSHPQQASLSMTDIVEDPKGRIWSHNFSGQIFYIEGGKMNLYKLYGATLEKQFPRMALCGDELLATSDHGLFVCSLEDLKSVYHSKVSHPASGYSSLAVLGNKAVLFDNTDWYLYSKGASIKKLKADSAIHFDQSNFNSLQPAAAGNSFFVVSNPSGIVQMIELKNDSLLLQTSRRMNDFVNAVTLDDRTWIHTRNKSETLDGQLSIDGRSLTDAVKDNEGNTWFSSLKQGLMVSYKIPQWSLIQPAVLEKKDFIRCLNTADGYFFAGSNKGNLMILDSNLKNITWERHLFDGYGSIDFIRFYKNHRFVVGTSTNTYIINPVEKKLEGLLPLSSVKDVDFDEQSLFLSTSNGFYVMPYLLSISLVDWLRMKQKQFPFLKQTQPAGNPHLFVIKRTRAIRYDKQAKSLFVASKDGLNEVNEKGINPFYVNGKPVFASSMWYKDPQLFIATFNDGLWIKKGKDLRHFTTANFLVSNTILRTKATRNYLWLFENQGMQILNIETGALLKDIDLPGINGANVFDVAEWKGYGYLTTVDGIYKVPLTTTTTSQPLAGQLDAVIVNNKDTLSVGASLPYNHNDIQFAFSCPAFFNPQSVTFKYHLKGADEDWQTTKPGERLLRYPSLPPGAYGFEAYAFNEKGGVQGSVIAFDFRIKNPWWAQWWFITLLLVLIIGLIYVLYRNSLQQLLRVEKIRRSISSDLHDDIGATLSSMTIYTNLARTEKNNSEYLNLIEEYAKEVINKLDDLVWSINPKNDTCEQLINRMQFHAEPLLHAAGIDPHFSYNSKVVQLKLDLFIKNNVYLLFKEIINNVIKHAGAANCYIAIECQLNSFILSVEDDGKGYDPSRIKLNRHGLVNMNERVHKMKGSINMESVSQKGVRILVTIPV